MIYQAYGLNIKSDVHLCDTQSASTDFDLQIILCSEPFDTEEVNWFHEIREEVLYCKYGEDKLSWLCLVPDLAVYRINKNLKSLELFVLGDKESSVSLLMNQILPLYLSLKGEVVLHASALAKAGEATLFVAQSGTGKSTLAAQLIAENYTCLTDDAARVVKIDNEYRVQSSFPEIRLYPENLLDGRFEVVGFEAGKNRYDIKNSFKIGQVAIARVVILQRGDENCWQKLSSMQAFPVLLQNLYRMAIGDDSLLKSELELLSDFISAIPVYSYTIDTRQEGIDALLLGIEESI